MYWVDLIDNYTYWLNLNIGGSIAIVHTILVIGLIVAFEQGNHLPCRVLIKPVPHIILSPIPNPKHLPNQLPKIIPLITNQHLPNQPTQLQFDLPRYFFTWWIQRWLGWEDQFVHVGQGWDADGWF
jgi:hypothetical protein